VKESLTKGEISTSWKRQAELIRIGRSRTRAEKNVLQGGARENLQEKEGNQKSLRRLYFQKKSTRSKKIKKMQGLFLDFFPRRGEASRAPGREFGGGKQEEIEIRVAERWTPQPPKKRVSTTVRSTGGGGRKREVHSRGNINSTEEQ